MLTANSTYRVGPSIVEQLRERGPQWLWDLSYGFDPVQKADGRDFEDAFRSAGFDREGRLRGLKLYVDDSIEVLAGDGSVTPAKF